MNKNTELVCLADGAANCRSIAYSVEEYCQNVTYILDWFHVGMKFKNYSSAVPEEHRDLYDNIKWNLWHGNTDKALQRFDELNSFIKDTSVLTKLNKLYVYIENSEPPRDKPRGIKSALSRVQAALAPCLLSPVAQYIF